MIKIRNTLTLVSRSPTHCSGGNCGNGCNCFTQTLLGRSHKCPSFLSLFRLATRFLERIINAACILIYICRLSYLFISNQLYFCCSCWWYGCSWCCCCCDILFVAHVFHRLNDLHLKEFQFPMYMHMINDADSLINDYLRENGATFVWSHLLIFCSSLFLSFKMDLMLCRFHLWWSSLVKQMHPSYFQQRLCFDICSTAFSNHCWKFFFNQGWLPIIIQIIILEFITYRFDWSSSVMRDWV